MRIIAAVMNLAVLVGIVCVIADNGWPGDDAFLLFLFFIVTAIINLIALKWFDVTKDGCGLLALFLRRKAMEEQAKIDQIRNG